MHLLTKEKVLYTAQTFLMFLNIAQKTQVENIEDLENFKEKILNLIGKLHADQMDPLACVLQINQLIEEVNRLLKAPYPLLMLETPETFVKGEIVAFEHYLHQELKAHHLTLQQEAPIFNDSLVLWEKVGTSLSAQEGASEFAALIEKLNSLLPEDEKYPAPDKDQH